MKKPAHSDPGRMRAFGLLLAAFLLLLAFRAWHRHSAEKMALYAAAALASGVAAMARPLLLGPVYKGAMKIAHPIGRVNTFLLMGFVYYLVLAPYAVLQRFFSGDLLDESSDKQDSYWIRRKEQPDRESYERQF